jgi:hypothetical protein
MNPTQFVAKWGGVVQKERAVSQSHFIDLHAYNWPPTLTDDQLLERLLALNLSRG